MFITMDIIQIFAFIISHTMISIISSYFLFFYLMKIRTGIISIIFVITLRTLIIIMINAVPEILVILHILMLIVIASKYFH